MIQEYGWQDYGTKHYENLYTKFNQGLRYWKFGIDMREVEIGADYDLSKPPYSRKEFDLLCEKVGETLDIDMDVVLRSPVNDWRKYNSYRKWIERVKSVYKSRKKSDWLNLLEKRIFNVASFQIVIWYKGT